MIETDFNYLFIFEVDWRDGGDSVSVRTDDLSSIPSLSSI